MAFPIRRYMDVVRGLSNRLRSRDSLVLIHEQQCTMAITSWYLAGVDSVSITLARANVESVSDSVFTAVRVALRIQQYNSNKHATDDLVVPDYSIC